jgi:cyclase
VEGARQLLRAGADKVAINSAAILRPEVLEELSGELGEQCVVLAVDAKYEDAQWRVYRSGGSIKTNLELMEWCQVAVSKGVGEILFTSMDHDGMQQGFALKALRELSAHCAVPIIASGGGGSIKDFRNLFKETEVSAGLAASIFHDAMVEIADLKYELHKSGLTIRISL